MEALGWRRLILPNGRVTAHFCSKECELTERGGEITFNWWAKRMLPTYLLSFRTRLLDLLLGR